MDNNIKTTSIAELFQTALDEIHQDTKEMSLKHLKKNFNVSTGGNDNDGKNVQIKHDYVPSVAK